MRKILEQTIEINHLEYADSFCDSVRKHPAFQLPLQLRTEPTYVPLSNGELLLISEYISNGLNSLLLNLFCVYKYNGNSWTKILAIPHVRKMRVHENTIYSISELSENRYSVCQYDLDGNQIHDCILENEPYTQIDLDSIYFTDKHIVYCYQYFLKQIPYVDRKKYVSPFMVEWRENREKDLLSVYAFSNELGRPTRLYNHSLNACGLRVRWKSLDGNVVYDKDLGIKSFQQIVTLLHNNIMQICYTDPNPVWIRPQNEYEYHVCFVYPDGAVQDCSQTIPKGMRTSFNMDSLFSETIPRSIFYANNEDGLICVYEIQKGKTPVAVYCTNGASTLAHLNFFSLNANSVEATKCIKFARDSAVQFKEYMSKHPIPPLSEKEEAEFIEYLQDCGSGKHQESLEEIFGLDLRDKQISKMKKLEDESPLRIYGIAYRKVFASTCLIDENGNNVDTSSALFYYDLDLEKGELIEANTPHKRYILGSVTDQRISYLSGDSAPRLGYRNAKLICKTLSGELLGKLDIDTSKLCLGAIEHQGIIHILMKNKVSFKTKLEMPPTILTHMAYLIN